MKHPPFSYVYTSSTPLAALGYAENKAAAQTALCFLQQCFQRTAMKPKKFHTNQDILGILLKLTRQNFIPGEKPHWHYCTVIVQ